MLLALQPGHKSLDCCIGGFSLACLVWGAREKKKERKKEEEKSHGQSNVQKVWFGSDAKKKLTGDTDLFATALFGSVI